MKAITVKYLPATNTRGSRLKAFDCDNNSVTINYDSDLNREELYAKAAYALRDKMGWKGQLVSGGTKDGEVFVFLPASITDLQVQLKIALNLLLDELPGDLLRKHDGLVKGITSAIDAVEKGGAL